METHSGEEVLKEKKFPHSRKPSHRRVCGEFWNLRGQHNQERKKKNTQNTHLTPTASGKVAQMLVSATSKWGLGREAQAASLVLRARTRPECPEKQSKGANMR